jgi:hypothetical protein
VTIAFETYGDLAPDGRNQRALFSRPKWLVTFPAPRQAGPTCIKKSALAHCESPSDRPWNNGSRRTYEANVAGALNVRIIAAFKIVGAIGLQILAI